MDFKKRISIITNWIALRLLDDFDVCEESIKPLAELFFKENNFTSQLSQYNDKIEDFVEAQKQAKITHILRLVKNVKTIKNFKGDIEISVFHDSRIDICELTENKIFTRASTLRDCLTLKDIRDLCCENNWDYSEI